MKLIDKLHRKVKKNDILSIYFGVPGAGKSTVLAYLCKKYCRDYPVYSNYPIKGAYRFDKEDIGNTMITDGVLLLDEASIDFNNRKYKNMPIEAISWFKLHRHYGMKVCVASQSWNDTDVTIRRIAYEYILVRKSLIPFHVAMIPIHRRISVNEYTKEPCDEYYLDGPLLRIFRTKRIFAPRYWKLFDSWQAPELEVKKMNKW